MLQVQTQALQFLYSLKFSCDMSNQNSLITSMLDIISKHPPRALRSDCCLLT